MSYFPKPSLNENDLAIIERGDTAANSIETGQYVSWHGRTGKAKAAILQGATLDNTLFDYDEDGILNSTAIKVGVVELLNVTLQANKSPGSVTAPHDTFICWIGVNSAGCVASVALANYLNKTTDVWCSALPAGGNGGIKAYYLYT